MAQTAARMRVASSDTPKSTGQKKRTAANKPPKRAAKMRVSHKPYPILNRPAKRPDTPENARVRNFVEVAFDVGHLNYKEMVERAVYNINESRKGVTTIAVKNYIAKNFMAADKKIPVNVNYQVKKAVDKLIADSILSVVDDQEKVKRYRLTPAARKDLKDGRDVRARAVRPNPAVRNATKSTKTEPKKDKRGPASVTLKAKKATPKKAATEKKAVKRVTPEAKKTMSGKASTKKATPKKVAAAKKIPAKRVTPKAKKVATKKVTPKKAATEKASTKRAAPKERKVSTPAKKSRVAAAPKQTRKAKVTKA